MKKIVIKTLIMVFAISLTAKVYAAPVYHEEADVPVKQVKVESRDGMIHVKHSGTITETKCIQTVSNLYTEDKQTVSNTDTECIQDVNNTDTEVTIETTNVFEEPAAEEPTEEPAEEPAEQNLEYLGTWVLTAYCNCESCCGIWAGGCTASGTLPEQGRTVACNSLPLGTRLIIDGCEYVVEDTGYSPYGDAWIDVYFEDHNEALCFGVRELDVYRIIE